MTNTKTQKEMFMEIKEVVATYGTSEQITFIDKKIEQLSRPRHKAPTETQKQNEVTKSVILDTLTNLGKAVTISELQDANETLNELSNQKMSALLRQLKESGEITRTVDKKKAYFSVNLD